MRGSRTFRQGVRVGMVQLWQSFFMRGGGIPNTTKRGPSSAHQRKRHLNGVSLAGRRWSNIECWLVSFVISQGVRTIFPKVPYSFVIFQADGWVVRAPLSDLWIRTRTPSVSYLQLFVVLEQDTFILA